MTYQPITYPKIGYIVVVRLNHVSIEPNTIRVVTKQSDSNKRELFVLKSLHGIAKELYDKKQSRYKDRKASVFTEEKTKTNSNANGNSNGSVIPTVL